MDCLLLMVCLVQCNIPPGDLYDFVGNQLVGLLNNHNEMVNITLDIIICFACFFGFDIITAYCDGDTDNISIITDDGHYSTRGWMEITSEAESKSVMKQEE